MLIATLHLVIYNQHKQNIHPTTPTPFPRLHPPSPPQPLTTRRETKLNRITGLSLINPEIYIRQWL